MANNRKTKLRAWMDRTGTTGEQIAEVCGCSSSAVYKWANGEGRPTWERAWKVARLTDGAVTVEDLMNAATH